MSGEEIAIQVSNVHKSFKLPHERHGSIKSAFVGGFKRKRTYEKQQVLKDISFEIKKGEFFGIVGRNGSGKSTLLKLLAGVYSPDKGAIHINGKLTPFIELGVGFNPELTGRENVFLNGALLGFSRKEMEKLYDEIVEFAELEKFMDQKLKNYSSGMQVRLAFSIAIRAKSEILLLDEVLAVGDALFQKKCYDYFRQLKREKRTVVFVSHDTNALLEYCDQGLLLENGEIVIKEKIGKVVNQYQDVLGKEEEKLIEDKKQGGQKSWGSGDAKIVKIQVLDDNNKEKSVFTDSDKYIRVQVSVKAEKTVEKPVFGITILDAGGQRVFTSNTLWSKVSTPNIEKGKTLNIGWLVPNAFNSGSFTISPAVSDNTGSIIYDWLDEALEFRVNKKIHSISYINIDHDIEIL